MAGRRSRSLSKLTVALIILTALLVFGLLPVLFPKLFSISVTSTQSPSPLTNVPIYIVSILSLVILSYIYYTLRKVERKTESTQKDIDERIAKAFKKFSNNAHDKKKNKFINLSTITFHYVNHKQTEDLYNQFFKEPIIEKVISERTGETDEEVKGQLPNSIIAAGISNKDTRKWTSDMRVPELPLSGKFLRFQRESIKQSQVVLGLEEVDIEDTELKAFQETIDTLKTRFGLELEQVLIEEKNNQLKAKAAERTLIKLENATGWILMEGKFKVQQEGDSYRFIYRHPVNDYISKGAGSVTFFISLPINSLEEDVKSNYALSVGSLIPLNIYGQVWRPIDRSQNTWDLQVKALAVYQ